MAQNNQEYPLGHCALASDFNGCIYYPCCKPSDRGEYCKTSDCRQCNGRKCKPNLDRKTINIDNVPCGCGASRDQDDESD